MYGTIARYRLKPGMEAALLDFERQVHRNPIPGFVTEFTFRMDDDPTVCYEAVIFDSREAYFALANSPAQDTLYQKFLALLEEAPVWHNGEVIHFRQAL